MIKPTLYAKWISLVFAAFVLAACSSNDTKEAEAAAAVQGGPASASASAGTTSPVRTSSGCTAATTSDALGRNSASWG